MRLVADTNVLISALLIEMSLPAHFVRLWRNGHFDLVSSPAQIEELRRVTRYPRLRTRMQPALAGRLINELRALAIMVQDFPVPTISPDPFDDYLLGMAAAGGAEFLVTGDKPDLLALGRYGGCRIVTVRQILMVLRRLP
jgi:putative PIN family toxin of toxin-antitoxin system